MHKLDLQNACLKLSDRHLAYQRARINKPKKSMFFKHLETEYERLSLYENNRFQKGKS